VNRPVTPVDDLVKAYRQAERRLHEMLFGDGTYTMGAVKGEESRLEASRALRRMRNAFNELIDKSETGRAEEAEVHVADLEEELQRRASSNRAPAP
jgi:hypothetical protein